LSAAFLITSFVIVATPGVGALFTLSEGLRHGARAGVVARMMIRASLLSL
jgi:threonine/homoserine/homoserine lactone efflux protein